MEYGNVVKLKRYAFGDFQVLTKKRLLEIMGRKSVSTDTILAIVGFLLSVDCCIEDGDCDTELDAYFGNDDWHFAAMQKVVPSLDDL